MPKAIRVHESGGPEVLQWQETEVGDPGPGEVLLRHTAIGLNFIDVYFRAGLYTGPEFPFTPGMEAAGVVEAAGSDVKDVKPGDRVAYATPPVGAYAERRLLPADRVVPIPDGIDDTRAAAMMLKGMTAQYLLRRTYHVQPGDTILIHAAAGGVGLIACQWADHLGATVIGTVSSQEKAELAAAHGCHHPIVYTRENFVERVMSLTHGQGVHVVYDSVGKDTFMESLGCVRQRGIMVSFGQSSGMVAPLDVTLLSTKGSLFLTRPTLMHYTDTREELVQTAHELMDLVKKGVIRVEVNQEFPLKDAASAHRALEERRTTGSTVLVP